MCWSHTRRWDSGRRTLLLQLEQIIPDLSFWKVWENSFIWSGRAHRLASINLFSLHQIVIQYKQFWSKRFSFKPCYQTFVLSGSLVIISRLVCSHYLTAVRRASWTAAWQADPLTQTRPRLNTKLLVRFTAAKRRPELSAKRGAPWSADTTHTSEAKW